MKIHIALVGGQTPPVYYGIREANPDKVVFVYSKESIAKLGYIRSVLQFQEDEQLPLDPLQPDLILERAKTLADRYKDDEVTVNISGGTKPWAYFFSIVFGQCENATILYVDQNNVMWDYTHGTKSEVLDIQAEVLFKLQGNPLKHYRLFSEYTKEDEITYARVRNMQKYNYRAFSRLFALGTKESNSEWKRQYENQQKGCFDDGQGNKVEWEKSVGDTLGSINVELKHPQYGVKQYSASSPHATEIAFNTGWFEYFVASKMAQWDHSKEVYMNCIFPESKNPNQVKFPKNEMDIIVNTGTKLLFVECKTKIFSSTDIDKFRTAVKNYGGNGSKSLFITQSKKTNIEKEKCRESEIMEFSIDEIRAEDPKWEEQLYRMLDDSLFRVNV